MAGIDEAIVREYFELNGFLVRQLRKHTAHGRSRKDEELIDLLVYNPACKETASPNFILFSNDLPLIRRAVIAVRAWHSKKFTASTLRASSEIFSFLEKDVLKKASDLFASDEEDLEAHGELKKILVLPGLPTHEPHRTESIELLRKHGVDGIISFRSMLQDILTKVEVNHSYTKSDLLQTLRILKNYDLIRSPQMDLFSDKK